MEVNIQFKRGTKINLPDSAPNGMPLWCEDTKELYIGTGSSVVKVNGSDGGETTSKYDLVTSLSESSTDMQYPSAKCVYDLIGNIETLLSEV